MKRNEKQRVATIEAGMLFKNEDIEDIEITISGETEDLLMVVGEVLWMISEKCGLELNSMMKALKAYIKEEQEFDPDFFKEEEC